MDYCCFFPVDADCPPLIWFGWRMMMDVTSRGFTDDDLLTYPYASDAKTDVGQFSLMFIMLLRLWRLKYTDCNEYLSLFNEGLMARQKPH